MSVKTLAWKLASPYDAYVAHVAVLNNAIEQIRYFSGLTRGYEAGLESSGRVTGGGAQDASARVQLFRDRLGDAAGRMTDEQFEDFIAHLGGGSTATVESDRAKANQRLGFMQRGLEDYFAIAGMELATLEQRGYNPGRPDVANQLLANKLPAVGVEQYRHLLHELGSQAAVNA